MKSSQYSFFWEAACCSLLALSPLSLMAQTNATGGKRAKVEKRMPVSKILVPDNSKPRQIAQVSPVVVSCPVGTAPVLPFRVWVNYSDGTGEYRQVRWSNAPLSDEQSEANVDNHPKGSQYTVNGYIIGDESTENGYLVTAKVVVDEDSYATPTAEKAHGFSLADVTIEGDNRLTHNREEALREICSWDVSQQLYNYRDTYGLSTEGYKVSDGWDSPDTKLKGHGSGHYMSAIAQAYAVTKDPQQKEILRKNITRMVNELRECQERTFVFDKDLNRYWEARDFAPEEELRGLKGTWTAFDEYKKHPEKYGYGYLNAIPAQHCALIEMYRAYNNSDWVWAPYYTVHKQLAGLIDIATYFDDKEIADKALLIAKDMGLWVWNRMHYRTYVKEDGTQDERRAKPGNRYEMWDMYIAGEVGGMSESLARLSELVTDKDDKAKLIEAANCFDAPKFFDPLSKNIDDIRTRHANQHIPMIIGALRSYKTNKNPYYYNLSQNFWNLIQGRYMYATGGVGNGEMFRQPYTQVLSMATNGMQEGETQANPDINETCCTYNLLKLTKDLNCYDPDNAAYMDYYERGLYNQIIGSLNPDQYQTCYQYAVGLNATKPFGNETPQSSCCGGTGSENHTKYQEATYFASGNTLWVGLYMPTTLQWKEQGVTLRQDCQWPAQHSTIKIEKVEGGSKALTIKLRVPYWATQGFKITWNGKVVESKYTPSSYVTLQSDNWKEGDVIEIDMPFTKHIEYGADKLSSEVASLDGTPLKTSWVGTLMYGPLAMTGTGATIWKQATLDLDSHLNTVKAVEQNNQNTGADANLLALSVGDKLFLPDYYRNSNSTHYYRINITDAVASKKNKKGAKLDMTELKSLLGLATQRKADQEKWNALAQKVPEYAPWAPYGYERMLKAMEQAQALLAKNKKQVTQDELEGMTSILNKAINTMRPGNLAEIEDLRPLSALLRRAGYPDENTNKELRDAIGYGRMVMKYVTDGSGTQDFIKEAIQRLKKATGQ